MKLLLLLLPLTLLPTLLRLEFGITSDTTEIAPPPPAVESVASPKPNVQKATPAPTPKKPRAKVSGRIPAQHALLFM